MPDKNHTVLDFLLSRRSRPAKTLKAPVPEREELMTLLTAAARTPDHGKLEPWRFLVIPSHALDRLAVLAESRAAALGQEPEKVEKLRRQFADADLVVAVVASPVESEKIPQREQLLSAGAVCLALLNAALAAGWGANWLTSAMATDPEFLETGLGLEPHETVAGFIHIGTEAMSPPERPRPDLTAKVTWVEI